MVGTYKNDQLLPSPAISLCSHFLLLLCPMEWTYLFFSLLFTNVFIHVSALRLPINRAGLVNRAITGASIKSTSLATAGNNSNLGSVQDIRYTTTIKVNEVEVVVLLDTGSTDIWVIPPGGLGPYNDTGIPLSLKYGDGSYGVNGTIGIAPFEFGSYRVEQQAFLHATSSTVDLTKVAIYGILGLGFNDPLLSPINNKVQAIYGSEQSWSASVLANIFQQHPSQPNIVTLELQRTVDLEDTDGGVFTIGEIDQTFAAVVNAPKLDQYPPGEGRWTTLMDGMRVDGTSVTLKSSSNGVPSGSVISLLDTGNPTLTVTKSMRDAIYSGISGAVFDSSSNFWFVPCNVTTIVEFGFSGQWYVVHPLDLTTVGTFEDASGNERTACYSKPVKVNPDISDGNGFEIVLGTPFLRNVYSVYDFGNPFASDDKGPTPYMQLLAETDPQAAASEAVAARQSTLSHRAPELSPEEISQLIVSDASSSVSASTDISETGSQSESQSTVEKYAPIVIGLLGANLVIGLILVVLGVLGRIRRGTRKTTENSAARTSYAPVGTKEEDSVDMAYHMPYTTR